MFQRISNAYWDGVFAVATLNFRVAIRTLRSADHAFERHLKRRAQFNYCDNCAGTGLDVAA